MAALFSGMKPRFSTVITGILIASSLLIAGSISYIVQREGQATAIETANAHFNEISSKTSTKINAITQSIATTTDLASHTFNTSDPALSEASLANDIKIMRDILVSNDQIQSAFIGFNNGNFQQLIRPQSNRHVLDAYEAPLGTSYILRMIRLEGDGIRWEESRFFDDSMQPLSRSQRTKATYDPRVRPWYRLAEEAPDRTLLTDPYLFSDTQLTGITSTRQLSTGHGVFGADVTLAQLGALLSQQHVSENGQIWIIDGDDRLLAHPKLLWGTQGEVLMPAIRSKNPVIADTIKAYTAQGISAGKEAVFLDIQGDAYMAKVTHVPTRSNLPLSVVIAAPLSDITGHIDDMIRRIFLFMAAALVLIVPVAVMMSRCASRPISMLASDSRKILNFDFSPSPPITSCVEEIQDLGHIYEKMKTTIQTKTDGLIQTQGQLELLVQEGLALAEEKDLAKLITLILKTTKEISQADGGVIYLREGNELGVELLSLNSESLVMGVLSDHPAPRVKVRPDIATFLAQNSVLRPACEAFSSKAIVFTDDQTLQLFPTGLTEGETSYDITSMISIPITTRRGEVLGIIQIFNPRATANGDITPETLNKFLGSVSAQAAITLDNNNLIKNLQDLFNGLVQVIATSIDAKSPYTAGHCIRVPELTELIAKEISQCQDGPLADIDLSDEDTQRQLSMAAWLHDCGKVTTPEYVVDKSTKLETIYNRIHELRMRFEVLRRDAELAYYQDLLDGDASPEQLKTELDERIAQLEDDFAFLAECNVGGEFITDEAIQRIQSIAQYTWQRYYSDRLGLSEEELRRFGNTPEPNLPATEALLADKKEHIVRRRRNYADITDVNGEPICVPENAFNRGEIYNLQIARGTLTEEERFTINEHTLNGLTMLRQIPFPEEMANVPDIASDHHENLKGTGYPFKKDKSQLSVEARILAIADIFEALTAADRPYRKTKTLMEALKIMSFMRNDKHIDPDIFDIFLTSGIPQDYAERHLLPEQNDLADITPFLQKTA